MTPLPYQKAGRRRRRLAHEQRDKKDRVDNKRQRVEHQMHRDSSAETDLTNENENDDDDVSAGFDLGAILNASLAVSIADSVSAFLGRAASAFPIMEEADFPELLALFFAPMTLVALIPSPTEPPSGRPKRSTCMESSSSLGPPMVPTGAPSGPSVLASKVDGGTSASPGCHGGEVHFGGQRFIRARPVGRGPCRSMPSDSLFTITS